MPKHLEPAGLHPVKDADDARLNAAAAVLEGRPLLQHVEALSTIKRSKLISRALIVLQAVVRPGAGNPGAPGLDRCSVHDRRAARLAISLCHVERIGVTIVRQ